MDAEVLVSLPDRLREKQRVFDRTGGLHAAGLFDAEGRLVSLREDVGRHNAVDKVVGEQLLAGAIPLADHVLQVSGRASFEIVQKAAVAGIPVVSAVSAPSSLVGRGRGTLRHDARGVRPRRALQRVHATPSASSRTACVRGTRACQS